MRLQSKSIVVTGAGSGIGQGIAKQCAEEGAKVVCVDINADTVHATVEDITAQGGIAHAVAGDTRIRDDVQQAVTAALEQYESLDVMINVVGGQSVLAYELDDINEENWQATLEINTKSTIWGCQLAAQVMKDHGSGSIINMSSINGIFSMGYPMYALAKGGIISFTRTIALELASHNIRCNVIVPGSIVTPQWDRYLEANPQAHEILKPMIPMNRLGFPKEVAHMAVYLASDESAFTTGGVFVMDGGFTIGSPQFVDFLQMTRNT